MDFAAIPPDEESRAGGLPTLRELSGLAPGAMIALATRHAMRAESVVFAAPARSSVDPVLLAALGAIARLWSFTAVASLLKDKDWVTRNIGRSAVLRRSESLAGRLLSFVPRAGGRGPLKLALDSARSAARGAYGRSPRFGGPPAGLGLLALSVRRSVGQATRAIAMARGEAAPRVNLREDYASLRELSAWGGEAADFFGRPLWSASDIMDPQFYEALLSYESDLSEFFPPPAPPGLEASTVWGGSPPAAVEYFERGYPVVLLERIGRLADYLRRPHTLLAGYDVSGEPIPGPVIPPPPEGPMPDAEAPGAGPAPAVPEPEGVTEAEIPAARTPIPTSGPPEPEGVTEAEIPTRPVASPASEGPAEEGPAEPPPRDQIAYIYDIYDAIPGRSAAYKIVDLDGLEVGEAAIAAGGPGASPPGRRVSTGFAPPSEPGQRIPPAEPLGVGARYLFWLEVGEPVAGAIDSVPTALPGEIPAGARLRVAVFAEPDGLMIVAGADVGEIELQADGTARVVRRPFDPPAPADDPRLAERRLFFPIDTPARAGEPRLTCNIYYNGVLVQSRIVTASVRLEPKYGDGRSRTDLDYSLSASLDPGRLGRIAPHKLSVKLGGDIAGATHVLQFLGEGEFKAGISLGEQTISTLIREARAALRRVTWGVAETWDGKRPYRYASRPAADALALDLTILALAGYRIYDRVITELARTPAARAEFERLMGSPGLVQFASTRSATELIPSALIYDHPIANTREPARLCPTFAAALRDGTPLDETACFRGECPSRGDNKAVCPSGFWGFRHDIGVPVSLADGGDLVTDLGCAGTPSVAASIWTGFPGWAQHEKDLEGLGLRPAISATLDDTFSMLKAGGPHVVYFYCHGGFSGGVGYLAVGGDGDVGITRADFRAYDICWKSPRPLVFINGCETAALEPSAAFDLVTGFIQTARAAGVIGTEITIFEKLACPFAQAFFRAFLVDDLPIGEAVRRARMRLLQDGNPLGLVYIPFALPSLTVGRAPRPKPAVASAAEPAPVSVP